MSGIYHKNKVWANVTIPNPQDAATDDLEKVKIDGTTYDVKDADAIHNADVGAAGGVAELDANGQVPSAQLPTPPTVNNNTITIQLNGTTVETFTLNQSSDETINIQVTKSDVGLGNVPNVTTDNQTPTVTEASTRANLASGDTLKTIIGKIKKYFSDLKDLAFIAKDGSSSTKYLRGDGTWQAFPSIPAAQVQSDWNQTDSAQVDFIKNKPTISDTKVTQNNTTTDSDRRVLLSASANDTNETNTARKSAKLKFNPSTGNLQATQLNGVNIGSNPKFTDENTTYTLSVSGRNIVLTPSSGSANTITVPYATDAGELWWGGTVSGAYIEGYAGGTPSIAGYASNNYIPTCGAVVDYLKSNYVEGSQITDLNAPLTEVGYKTTLHSFSSSASNKPSTNAGAVLTMATGTATNTWAMQFAFMLNGDIYYRARNASTGVINNWTKKV